MAFGSEQWMYNAGGGFYPHEIDNSVRFDTNSQLTRTPPSIGTMRTFTFSAWIKRSKLSNPNYDGVFSAGTSGTNRDVLYFDADDKLEYNGYSGSSYYWRYTSTRRFRDPSAWYHIVLSQDTEQSTAGNRVKLYVNGEQITEFDNRQDPNQTAVGFINHTSEHAIGSTPYDTAYFNGYMAEINFVDGQALDPTDFGETKSGVWIPKRYAGSYGTNGFYLDFGTRATDPIDASGNGNNWGSVNVVSTDWMLDSPTNNFATLNPLSKGISSGAGAIPLSEGNLEFTGSGTVSTYGTYYSTLEIPDTKLWYFEMVPTEIGTAAKTSQKLNVAGVFFAADGSTNTGSYGSAWSPADVIGVAVSPSGVWFSVNGVWQNSGDPVAGTNPAGTPYTAAILTGDGSATTSSSLSGVLNFGQDSSFAGEKTRQGNTDANGIGDFYYAPPAGYLALCSANLPDTAIDPAEDDIPADYFNTVLYTGNGSTQSITGVGFQPDWVWVKKRSAGGANGLTDSTRGTSKLLFSEFDNAEITFTGGIGSFDPDGFSLASGDGTFNASGPAYVGWNWKAGGTAVANTDGTIASQVSANTKSGFSIVTYTGTGTNATVGHGLSSAPEIVFWKNRSAAVEWVVQSNQLGGLNKLVLNTNAAEATDFDLGNFGSASSTTLALQNDTGQNESGQDILAYCFHSVDGFSKFGSYTGNGALDGTFVYTGFRPAYVMIKRTDSANDWRIYDTKRSNYNARTATLYANYSLAEYTTAGDNETDALSNGFKIRNTSDGYNASGGTYLYMAFAEMSFKYANAR